MLDSIFLVLLVMFESLYEVETSTYQVKLFEQLISALIDTNQFNLTRHKPNYFKTRVAGKHMFSTNSSLAVPLQVKNNKHNLSSDKIIITFTMVDEG